MNTASANERGATPVGPARILELDGLRGIAIGAVVVYHYFQLTHLAQHGTWVSYLQSSVRLGWSGVDLFFVLSGFLIGGILLDARTSTNYFKVFYRRRFFRIMPIYAVLLLAYALLAVVTQGSHTGDFSWLTANAMPWYSYWTFTQNLWMARSALFGANALAITWSLAVEEQFYLTMPLVIRWLSPGGLLRFVLAGICCAPALRLTIYLLWPQSLIAAYVLTPCRADALLLGVLAAILLRDPQWRRRMERAQVFWAVAFPILFLGLALLTWKAPNLASPLEVTVGYTWLDLFYFCLLLYALSQPKSRISEGLRMQPLRWLGSIAYGTYLIHDLILGTLFAIGWRGAPAVHGFWTLFVVFVSLALTLGLARLSWTFFERPLIKIGHRLHYEFEGHAAAAIASEEARVVYP